MADTVNLDEITEFRDSPTALAQKVERLGELIGRARHIVVFTGAGISTSASIADYRGPNGVWTRKAQGRGAPQSIHFEHAVPTPCHRWIAQGVRSGLIKQVVSQNVDGLHRRSGIPAEGISELHGNAFKEICWKCGSERLSATKVSQSSARQPKGKCAECRKRVPVFCHCTTSICPCGARMKDSVIHFGENLPTAELERAYEHAAAADVCIVLGSSLRVSPANEIPEIIGKKRHGSLVIVNLQKTPLDAMAGIRIYAETDETMLLLDRAMGADNCGRGTNGYADEPPTAPASVAGER